MPEDRPPVGVLAEVRAGQHAPERRAGRVLGAPDLLEHDVALALDLDGVERGVLRGVGQDVERGVETRAAGRTTWKYVQSCEVAAFISPPSPEIVSSITPGPRVGVPLKRRCSMKWDSPASSGPSSRAPARTQSWTAATSAASCGWSTR